MLYRKFTFLAFLFVVVVACAPALANVGPKESDRVSDETPIAAGAPEAPAEAFPTPIPMTKPKLLMMR